MVGQLVPRIGANELWCSVCRCSVLIVREVVKFQETGTERSKRCFFVAR